MAKTKEYMRDAAKRYRADKDVINLILPMGTKKIIHDAVQTGGYKSISAYILHLVLSDNGIPEDGE